MTRRQTKLRGDVGEAVISSSKIRRNVFVYQEPWEECLRLGVNISHEVNKLLIKLSRKNPSIKRRTNEKELKRK